MKQISGFLEGLAEYIEARPGVSLILACWAFVVATGIRAEHRAFWLDELLTLHICALPRFQDVWNVLCAGIDLNPPFQYLAVRGSWAVFGGGPLATRLPVVAGYLVMSVCVYQFLRRRLPQTLALAGMIVTWLAGTYQLALDARPYGILLGCSGLTLVCWSRAASLRRPRWPALAGLGLSLGIGLLTHCYAVLLALPIILGELRRFTQHRKPDWPMWLTLAFSALPVGIYPVLVRADTGQLTDLWPFHVTALTAPDAYREMLDPIFWPLFVSLLLMVLAGEASGDGKADAGGFSSPEVAVLAGFALIPAAAVALAALTTGTFALRYGSPGIIGIACLLPCTVARCSPRKASRNGAALAAVLLLFFTIPFALQLWAATRSPVTYAASQVNAPAGPRADVPGYPLIARVPPGDLPLVLSSAAAFFEVGHYADDALVARTYYLTDPEVALRRTGSSSLDLMLAKMPRLIPLKGHVEAADRFLAAHRTFMVYCSGQFSEWLVPELLSRGWEGRLLARQGRAEIVAVTAPSDR